MSKDYIQETQDLYIKAMIGNHVYTPFNMIFQGTGDSTKATGVFQFQADPALIKSLTAGANLHSKHVLWIGDAFFRPKIITESRHLQGFGIAGIYKDGFVDVAQWIEKGKILFGEGLDKVVAR
jgi:hypothetical protein